MRLLLLSLVVVSGLVTAASEVALARTPTDPAVMQLEFSKISGMRAVVDHLAQKDLQCADVSECVSLAMGSRACGGPTSFVVTSKLNASLDAISEGVNLVTQAERDANKKFGMMSICSIQMPPPLECVNNLCAGGN